MKAVFYNWVTNTIASRSPVHLRTSIYKWLGVENSEEIRKHVFIQSIKAFEIGKNSFINRGTKIYNGFDGKGNNGKVIIGTNVTIGYDVSIFTTTHQIGRGSQRADFNDIKYKDVEICDGTWICANCIILPGVRIGKGCVIAAGSVVTKDCDDNCLYGGNPAIKIKPL